MRASEEEPNVVRLRDEIFQDGKNNGIERRGISVRLKPLESSPGFGRQVFDAVFPFSRDDRRVGGLDGGFHGARWEDLMKTAEAKVKNQDFTAVYSLKRPSIDSRLTSLKPAVRSALSTVAGGTQESIVSQ